MWSAVCNGDRQVTLVIRGKYYTYCSVLNTTACRTIYGCADSTLSINVAPILTKNIGLDIGYNHNNTSNVMKNFNLQEEQIAEQT